MAHGLKFCEILRIIGPAQQHAMMQSSGTPIVYRSFWKCGCTVDCADPYAKGGGAPVADWVSCGAHTR